MPTYRVPVRLTVDATAYVDADSFEAAVGRASREQWDCYLEQALHGVHVVDADAVQEMAAEDMDHVQAVLRQRVEAAHDHAEGLSQRRDHSVLHLLDAALVLLGAGGFHREQALLQASQACQRALGTNPPAWAEMRALLADSVEQLYQLHSLTAQLDDAEGADGQDWSHTRDAADDLATRARTLLGRLEQPSTVPLVRVDVCGGRATVICKPYGTAVEVRDYDTEGVDPPIGTSRQEDDSGADTQWYTMDYLGPDEEVMG